MSYRAHPFHWVPGAGQRHASTDARPVGTLVYPAGTEVSTLCEESVQADSSEIAWLWPTCSACNRAAHKLAGLPPVGGAR
ncbi:hypothetical protein LZ318_25925 [Saccharopolyspora indica]|uniref:zinc finger protein n=1 Tax=Saccharopolyspora indica TaxID=1229659 RepID=UPI0022EA7A7F|nr:zinc finger protein [Saccharopolyspora indica]MDA3646647.1 hypothetical protein [Saccharopolyspora indica]